ncbi:MAG: hypothetical protein IPL46_26530 [Saprospiraceae bacterium]|nr:hypothetical protein [Saprospiraceae bacterium]
MRPKQIHKSKHSTIDHHTKDGICQISLTEAIADEATLKNELLLLAAHTQKNAITKVLVHNNELRQPISSEFQQWARNSIELPLLNAGVDKIAIVHPQQEHVFALINNNDTKRKRYFSSVEDATAWLKE